MMSKLSLLQLWAALMVIASTAPVLGYNTDESSVPFNINETYFSQLMLTIYVDETGKALITGYVDELGGLPFLKTAQYLYESDTHQLYALTNSLASKAGDSWALDLTATSSYTDFHTVFYLPKEVQMGQITCSEGLNYLLSLSNESFVIEVQGYDIESPVVRIEYQQPSPTPLLTPTVLTPLLTPTVTPGPTTPVPVPTYVPTPAITTTPTPVKTPDVAGPKEVIPGFEVIFAIAGILMVYLIRLRKIECGTLICFVLKK